MKSYHVVDMACGSGDAQTLCITDDDNVWSWGDGDYGKLGKDTSFCDNLPSSCVLLKIYISYCLCHSELDPCGDSITLEFNQVIDIYENLSNMCTNAQENGLCHSIYCQIVVQSKCYNFHY